DVKLQMPIWKHPAVHKPQYENACRRQAATCLRLNHNIKLVRDLQIIATRRTTVQQKPHTINPSGIRRKNCGCRACQRDRVELGCKHPGICIDTAKSLIDSIQPKWSPNSDINDLVDGLSLTREETELNSQPVRTGEVKIFDP
ncbi:hypothetical protein C8J57DRAFT_981353, partial [Mycena rebaudengoi]